MVVLAVPSPSYLPSPARADGSTPEVGIFERCTLAQDFFNGFLGYCQHARITQEKTSTSNILDQCLTTVAKWYWKETKFVGAFTDWNTFKAKFVDHFSIEVTTDAWGYADRDPVHQGQRALAQLHQPLLPLPV